jgi:anti-sigma B factor antagonist
VGTHAYVVGSARRLRILTAISGDRIDGAETIQHLIDQLIDGAFAELILRHGGLPGSRQVAEGTGVGGGRTPGRRVTVLNDVDGRSSSTLREYCTTLGLMSRSCVTNSEIMIDPAGTTFGFELSEPALARLCGELDLAAVVTVRHRLVGADGDVDLDCSGLTFIDASGLRLFVAVHQACEGRGAKLAIVNPSRCVMRLLALTGLDNVLTVRRMTPTR